MKNWRPFARGVGIGILAAVLLGLPTGPLRADEARGRTKLVFWNLFTTGVRLEATKDIVRRFNEANGDFYVEQVDIPYPQIHGKMLPATVAEVAPDVSLFDRFLVASYAARGAFLELDKLFERDGIRKEQFFKAPWEECIYNGRQYAAPYDTDVRVLFYNRAHFREVGLDPNRPPRTWSELRRYSEKLTKRRPDGRLKRVGYSPTWGNVGDLYLYGWQNRGRFVSDDGRTIMLNHPKNVEALEWLGDFVNFYGGENLRTLQTAFGPDTQYPFLTGKVSMALWHVGWVEKIKRFGPKDLDWSACPSPYADDGVPATWSGGFSLVIPRGGKNVGGAWAFCKHVMADETQRRMAGATDALPALLKSADMSIYDKAFREWQQKRAAKLTGETPQERTERQAREERDRRRMKALWRLAIDEMKHSHYRPVTPAGSAMRIEMKDAIDHVIHGKRTPKQALDLATRKAQDILDRFHEKAEGAPVNWPTVALALGGALGLLLVVRGWFSFRRVRAMNIHRRQAMAGYLFALPAILGLALFTLGPILLSGVYSLTRYEILTPATWSGMENYRKLFAEDEDFLMALWNTFYYAAISVPVNITLSLGLALLLNRKIGGRSLYRTCFYLPTVMPIVAGSLLWLWLFNGENGLINIVLGSLHLPRIPWLTSADWSKPALIVMGAWGIGGGMIIFLAALQGVPRTLYEAAEIDGAGAGRKFLNVTLPMISPAMFFMVVMGIIHSLQVFAQAYLMTEGGPVNSTLFYVLYLYRQAFENLHMGYASAMAWVLFSAILMITGLQFVLARRWVYYEGAQR